VKILVSEDTKKQCHDIVFRYVDNVRVKGKQDEIKIYEPITLKETITTSITRRLDIHRQSFENYLQGDWQQAAELFNQQFNESQEILYQLYLGRIESFSGKPPPGWDTVYKHQSK
jgi:adenylate cyclase